MGQTLYQAVPLETNISLQQHFTTESSRELMYSEEYHSMLRKLNNKQRQVVMFLLLLFKWSSHLPFVSFSFLSISILSVLPFSILSLLSFSILLLPFSILYLFHFSILSLLPFLITPSLSTIPFSLLINSLSS